MMRFPLSYWRGVVLAVAVLAWLVAFGSPEPSIQAQQDAEPLDVVQVKPNIYLIAGDGGNIVVQTGPDGVVLVDSGTGERSSEVLEVIRTLSDQPIRYIVNTAAHPDHVGGNGTIAAAGVILGRGGGFGGSGGTGGIELVEGLGGSAATKLAHENVLLRMSAPHGQIAPFDAALWPTLSFIDQKNFYLNGEAIQVMHQPAAHSNGDSIVFFRRSDVLATGSLIDTTQFPIIDVAAGGSVEGLIDALNVLVEIAIPPTPLIWQPGGTQVVPGRGHVMEQAGVVEYRDMVTIIRNVVRDMADDGMTLDQIQAADATRGYTRRYGADVGEWTTAMFVEAVYRTIAEDGAR
jgi:glyoxylase-like metal-dependent hydrolase (beta-lactamase superfamily II)